MIEALSAAELIVVLRHRCDAWGGQRAFCASVGLSETLISLVLAGKQKPGPKIARALGYQKKVVFVPLLSEKVDA